MLYNHDHCDNITLYLRCYAGRDSPVLFLVVYGDPQMANCIAKLTEAVLFRHLGLAYNESGRNISFFLSIKNGHTGSTPLTITFGSVYVVHGFTAPTNGNQTSAEFFFDNLTGKWVQVGSWN